MNRAQAISGAYEAWNRGQPDAASDVLDPAFEIRLPDTGMNTGTFRGRDGMQRFLDSYLEVFEFFRFDLEGLEEAGDRVVALVHVTARGRGSGVEVELRPAHVWSFDGDRAIAVDVVPEREDALK